jgi:hypothetical protein
MLELVVAHAGLPDRMDAAVWIRQGDADAWLVELLPELPADAHPSRPVQFNPGRSFRHALNLIAANRADLERALGENNQLATWVADGEVLHGGDAGRALVELARKKTRHGHAQAG